MIIRDVGGSTDPMFTKQTCKVKYPLQKGKQIMWGDFEVGGENYILRDEFF